MNLGRMRHRITLMAEHKSQGAGGRLVTTTPIIADVWSRVDQVSGEQINHADGQFLSENVTFEIHYFPGYSAARRIDYAGRTYRVKSVQKTEGLTPMLSFQTVWLQN